MTAPAPPIRFDEVRQWITGQALPLWTGAGLDLARGGAVEALDFDGEDAALPYKRVRAQARQVYAFTQAHLMGWSGEAAGAADHVWGFLSGKARRADGGWVRRLTREGDVLDPVADTYDMAFILYALAWRSRGGDESAMRQAHDVLDAMQRLLAFDDGVGFRAAEDKPQARLQNPHMHLLEASLELAEAGRDQRFADLAGKIVSLFEDRMFDRRSGAFVEAYGEGWRPIGGSAQAIEPGHLYEWTWLLNRQEAVTGRRLHAEARALTAFAEGQGMDGATRLVDDGLDGSDLEPRRTYRLWPLTEALKAHLALFEHQGVDSRARIAEITGQLLDHHLADAPPGGWMDQYGPGWSPLATNIPSSILYHLLLAFSDLLRLQGALQAAAVP